MSEAFGGWSLSQAISMFRSPNNPTIWGLPLELPPRVLSLEYRYLVICHDGRLLAESSGNSRQVIIDLESLDQVSAASGNTDAEAVTREFEQADVLLLPITIGNLN
jgi:hypothetical protein